MNLLKIFTFLFLLQVSDSLLIRSNEIYQKAIVEVRDYLLMNPLILLYSSFNFQKSNDIATMTRLMKLQLYFNKLSIPTAITNIETFLMQDKENLTKATKSLIVFLNDSEDMKLKVSELLSTLVNNRSVWLLFITNRTEIEMYFKNIYVPLNCRFIVSQKMTENNNHEKMVEVYHTYQGSDIKRDYLLTWTLSAETKWPKLAIYQKRNNLSGHTLRITYMHHSINNGGYKDVIRNVADNILDELIIQMNFTKEFHIVQRKDYCPDGDVCREILQSYNNSDIYYAEAALSYLDIGREYFDLISPIVIIRSYLYIKEDSSTSFNQYVKPFGSKIWITIGNMIFVLTCLSVLVEYTHDLLLSKKSSVIFVKEKHSVFKKFMDTIFLVFSILCGQATRPSVLSSIRTIQFTTYLTMVVISASYSAVLTRLSALDTFQPPFKNLQGLLKDKLYTLGIAENTTNYFLFKNSKTGIMKEVYDKKMSHNNLSLSAIDGLERVCEANKFALVTDEISEFLFNKPNDCTLKRLERITSVPVFLMMKRNSPYRESFNGRIYWLKESGILQRIMNSEWKLEKITVKKTWTSVSFTDIIILNTWLIGGCVLSLLVFWAEKVIYRKQMMNRPVSIRPPPLMK